MYKKNGVARANITAISASVISLLICTVNYGPNHWQNSDKSQAVIKNGESFH